MAGRAGWWHTAERNAAGNAGFDPVGVAQYHAFVGGEYGWLFLVDSSPVAGLVLGDADLLADILAQQGVGGEQVELVVLFKRLKLSRKCAQAGGLSARMVEATSRKAMRFWPALSGRVRVSRTSAWPSL